MVSVCCPVNFCLVLYIDSVLQTKTIVAFDDFVERGLNYCLVYYVGHMKAK